MTPLENALGLILELNKNYKEFIFTSNEYESQTLAKKIGEDIGKLITTAKHDIKLSADIINPDDYLLSGIARSYPARIRRDIDVELLIRFRGLE